MAVTFFSEMIKFAAAAVLSMFGGKEASGSGAAGWLSNFRRISRSSAGLFFIPALIYVFVNNLRFYIIQRINPGLLQVLWNLKIAFVGILYALPPFRRPLTLQQWAGATLLVLGSTIAELSQGQARDPDGGLNTGGTAGLLLLLTGLVVTSLGAISCEYAYKHTARELDFTTQCCLLYGYGTILNLLVFSLQYFLSNSRKDEGDAGSGTSSFSPMSLTEGFDAWAWAVVVSSSISGFLVGMIFKYIDTVAQVFSDMCAMFVTSGVAWLVFGLDVNPAFLLALAICTISLLVYYSVVCPVKGGAASPSVSIRAEDGETHETSLADDEEDGKGITLQPLLLGATDVQQEQAEQEGGLADGDGYVRINSPVSAQNRKGNSIGIGDDALDVDDEGQGGEFEREL